MKSNLKMGLVVALVLVMSLAVAGCTSNTSTSNSGSANQSQQALTLSATQIPANDTVTAYYGSDVVVINATFTNNNAGTFKISTDNFYLSDSGGYSHNPLNPVKTDVSDSGYYNWMRLYFTVAAGTTPSTLRYYDGNFDVSCTVTT